MNTRLAALWIVAMLMLAACGDDGAERRPSEESSDTPSPSAAPGTGTPTVDGEIASGLNVPWSIVFADDGSALVSQRGAGSILRIQPDGTTSELGSIPQVAPAGEGGLLGLALSDDERTLFAYVSTGDDNRVLRMTLDGDRLGKPEPILTGLPRASNHSGGALLYDDEDDVLYVSVGDALRPQDAQDPEVLNGKILRIGTDGAPAEGNPFGNEVWSLGHRNVEGLAFDAEGRLWASEFGDKTADELNLIESAGNYGWPEVEGPSDDARFVAPKASWPTDEASVAGLAIVDGTAYLGALRGERLWAVRLDGEDAAEPEAYLTSEYGRIRALAAADDGTVWMGTSNTDGRGDERDGDDRLLRLTFGADGS